MPPPQLSARVQWAITHADGQQELLTGGPSLLSDTGFGTNVSLLMAYQCADEEAVEEAHEHEVAHAD